MNQIWIGLIVLAFLLAVGFFIALLVELKKTARSLQEFLKSTGESIKPTLEELQQTLKSLRKVSDDINTVTGDIKTFSSAAREMGQNIKHANDLIENVTSSIAINISGLKVGLKTAFLVLFDNLFLKRGGK
ncbi:MAG: DUF948 domain-containing protein [Nitrospira sp.]|nr:DUF948 domain-containing protein [Nitrospira sp.]